MNKSKYSIIGLSMSISVALIGCASVPSTKNDVEAWSSSTPHVDISPILYGHFLPSPPIPTIGYSLTVVEVNGEKIGQPQSKIYLPEGENTVKVVYSGCPVAVLVAICAIFWENKFQILSFDAKKGQKYVVGKETDIVIQNLLDKKIVSNVFRN